jgi:peptide/nickel transport system permease protein
LFIVFILVRIVPGNPAVAILGTHATPATVAALRQSMHLNVPLPDQLWLFVRSAAGGNLGTSLVYHVPSTSLIIPALGTTLMLTSVAVLIALFVGIPLGMLAGFTRSSAVDASIRSIAITLLAVPAFLIGFVLLLVAALDLHFAPAGGWGTSFFKDTQYVWLPGVALAAYLIPIVLRAVRQSTKQTLEQEFIEATISRGVGTVRLAFRHVLPNSLLPLITLIGASVGGLLGGAVVIESIFNLPGVGTVLVTAVNNRDYPVIQGTAVVVAVLVILVNLGADLLSFAIDPRIRDAE